MNRKSNAVTSTGYAPDFDIDNRRGVVGERLFGTFLEELARGTIEVKTDYGAWETGNHYVETAQQGVDGEWRKSGINATQADWWCVAGPVEVGFVCISVVALRKLCITASQAEQPIRGKRSNPTKGRLVKMSDIVAAVMAQA